MTFTVHDRIIFLTKWSKHCGGVGNIVIISSAYMNMFERVRNLECKMIHELPISICRFETLQKAALNCNELFWKLFEFCMLYFSHFKGAIHRTADRQQMLKWITHLWQYGTKMFNTQKSPSTLFVLLLYKQNQRDSNVPVASVYLFSKPLVLIGLWGCRSILGPRQGNSLDGSSP